MEEITNIIKEIVFTNFDLQINDEQFKMAFEDVGLDELEVYEIKMILEEKYSIIIPDDEAIITLEDLAFFVENCLRY